MLPDVAEVLAGELRRDQKGRPGLVHAFIAKGACANACDKKGSPAILWTVGSSKIQSLKPLIQAGADPNVKDPGRRDADGHCEAKEPSGNAGYSFDRRRNGKEPMRP